MDTSWGREQNVTGFEKYISVLEWGSLSEAAESPLSVAPALGTLQGLPERTPGCSTGSCSWAELKSPAPYTHSISITIIAVSSMSLPGSEVLTSL